MLNLPNGRLHPRHWAGIACLLAGVFLPHTVRFSLWGVDAQTNFAQIVALGLIFLPELRLWLLAKFNKGKGHEN